MAVLTNTGTFAITSVATAVVTTKSVVFPAVGYPHGFGRLVHPTIGAFPYSVKPDKWVNIDGDIIVAPVWAGTKTLGGAVNSLWPGSIANVICEEQWGDNQNGMAMPIGMLRTLIAIWSTPIDPEAAYVQWFPTYTSNKGWNVILSDLIVGSGGGSQMARFSGIGYQTLAFTDLVNALNTDGTNNGWVGDKVTLFLKIVSEV